jgi:hypothetical protein
LSNNFGFAIAIQINILDSGLSRHRAELSGRNSKIGCGRKKLLGDGGNQPIPLFVCNILGSGDALFPA